MAELFILFITSFAVAFSGAVMPGPLLTATIGESPRHGPLTGPYLILGHAALEAVLVAALLAGLAPLLQKPAVTAFVSLVGAGILLWMAFGMLRGLSSLEPPAAGRTAPGGGSLALRGILLSLANPYWTIWWATIGLGLILQSRVLGAAGVAFFFGGHVLGDLVWYTFVSTAVAQGRRWLTRPVYRGLIGACAGLLVLFGLLFLGNGASIALGS